MKICIREVWFVDHNPSETDKCVPVPPQYCDDEAVPYVEVFSIAAREAISVRQKYGHEGRPGFAKTAADYDKFATLLTTLASELGRGVKSVFTVLDRSTPEQKNYVPFGHEDAVAGGLGMYHCYVVGNALHIKLEPPTNGMNT